MVAFIACCSIGDLNWSSRHITPELTHNDSIYAVVGEFISALLDVMCIKQYRGIPLEVTIDHIRDYFEIPGNFSNRIKDLNLVGYVVLNEPAFVGVVLSDRLFNVVGGKVCQQCPTIVITEMDAVNQSTFLQCYLDIIVAYPQF